MPPLVILAAVVTAASLGVLLWLTLAPNDRIRQQVLVNITAGFGPTDVLEGQGAKGDSLATRIARLLAAPGTVARLEKLLTRAGRPAGWTLERLLLLKLVVPIGLAALGYLYLRGAPTTGRYLLVGLVVLVGHWAPDLLMQSRGQERQTQMGKELPDTLDQMTIAVEAGLGFEGAMLRAASNGKGPLSDELIRTLQDMQLGQSRRDAYTALADRTTVNDLKRFLRAVIQADAYGIAIADVLRTQAAEMRLKRRQAAEEKAMKIPVKVIFPLMLCILPALFIVLLGPAAINMVHSFK